MQKRQTRIMDLCLDRDSKTEKNEETTNQTEANR